MVQRVVDRRPRAGHPQPRHPPRHKRPQRRQCAASHGVSRLQHRKPHTGTELTQALAPYFLDWAAHPDYDNYWKQWSIEENYPNIQVPALTVAAWYDIFQGGSLRNYLGLKAHAGNESARSGQHLLMMIGGHAGGGSHIGTVDFGPAAAEYDENTVILEWYDYLFQGKQNDFATDPVKIFVMGENKWRYEDAWPLERAKSTRYFLHSSGKANSSSGDGALSAPPPNPRSPIHSPTIPLIPFPRQAAHSVAIRVHLARRPARSEGS